MSEQQPETPVPSNRYEIIFEASGTVAEGPDTQEES